MKSNLLPRRKTIHAKGSSRGPASGSKAESNGQIRKIIVIGGSAGGISSLCKVVEGLPRDLPAALLAVVHMFEGSTHLPEVLQRCGPMKVLIPCPAEPITAGRIYLPRPNHHLVVRDGYVGT